MTIQYLYDIEQNTPEWLALRRGIITASNISKILTPAKLEITKSTGYLYDFCRQTLDTMPYGDFSTRHTDRGHIEETRALQDYHKKHGDNFGVMRRCGFVLNDNHGFKIGCSPDVLVGDDGGVQVKSFTPNVQFGNIVEDKIERDHILQTQMELFVSERKWWDILYQSSGTVQMRTRVTPDAAIQEKIKEACSAFYKRVEDAINIYREKITDETRFMPTAYVAGLYDQVDEEMEME